MRGFTIATSPRPVAAGVADGAAWGETVTTGTVRGNPCLVYERRPSTITQVLVEARRWPDRAFIVHGSRVLTFSEHERLVHSVAARLHAEGVRRGDRVAVFAANSPEWVSAFFAILLLGAVAVPCNGWWSAPEMAQACDVVDPILVCSDAGRAARSPRRIRQVAITELVGGSAVSSPPAIADYPCLTENDPAVILFTAGTTTFPKGATLSHRSLVANTQTLLTIARKLPHQISNDNPSSVTLVGLPLFHIGAIQLILVPMVTGGEVVFFDGRFDAGRALELIESRRVTMFSGVPTMMRRILAHTDVAVRDLNSLRSVVLGGSPVDDALLAQVRDAFPNAKRGAGKTYGLTEAGGVVSTGIGAALDSHAGSAGRLAPVVEVTIADPDEHGCGEILVRSPASMDGYWAQPAENTIDADGWIHTGDVGRVDDERFLYVTGRAKDVIIRGGENVSAAQVEAILSQHPAVSNVAVVGLGDPDLGEVVGAAITPADSVPPRVEELETFAREHLAHFAVPTRWWIRTEALPMNEAGKILKSRIRESWPG